MRLSQNHWCRHQYRNKRFIHCLTHLDNKKLLISPGNVAIDSIRFSLLMAGGLRARRITGILYFLIHATNYINEVKVQLIKTLYKNSLLDVYVYTFKDL